MATVYLAFHATDKAVADGLAAELVARGHKPLIPRNLEDADKHRNVADAMIIVATRTSLSSALVYEDVRVAHHRKIPRLAFTLVPIDKCLETLLQQFGPISFTGHVFAELIDAVEKLWRSMIRRGQRQPRVRYALDLERLQARELKEAKQPGNQALQLEQGKLVHRISDQMRKGSRELVEVRLASVETRHLALGLMGGGSLVQEELPIVETMTIELVSPTDALEIEPQTRKTQLVKSDHLQGIPLDAQRFGRWLWAVTPKKVGRHELVIRVSADVRDGRGLPSSTALPDRLFTVTVNVDYAKAAVTTAKWVGTGLAGMFLAGLIGAYTQEVWWAKLKVWMGF